MLEKRGGRWYAFIGKKLEGIGQKGKAKGRAPHGKDLRGASGKSGSLCGGNVKKKAQGENKKKSVKKKVFLIATPILSAVMIAVIVLSCIYFFAPRSNPQYIAHMGYHRNFTGNTEKAFKTAASMDFYGIETDIRKGSTGVYYCHHDPLTKIRPEEETHFCTFAEYLDICKSGNKMAIVELKENFPEEDVHAILDLIDQHYDRKKVSIISFYFDVLLRVKAEDPSIPLQYLSDHKNDPNFDRCIKEKFSVDVSQRILTKKLVKKFHKAGLTVNVWNVNKEFDRTIARIKGADYITSDVFCKN